MKLFLINEVLIAMKPYPTGINPMGPGAWTGASPQDRCIYTCV